MKILITGSAGFIGFHLANKLLSQGHTVIGIDNINDYYDVELKYARLKQAGIDKNKIAYGSKVKSSILPVYTFIKLDLLDREKILSLFAEEQFDFVCNLAAQAGVRYSLENPHAYVDSNITGFLNILEACRTHPVKHLVYASSSSVYGTNEKIPFAINDMVNHPISLYAATKRSNELMAYTYSHLYNIPVTGLRFFTVYGPWGRPDMAYFKFTNAICNNKPIEVFNNGDMSRDFTYIDDIVEGITAAINTLPQNYALHNLGNNQPERLLDFIQVLEKNLGRKAEKKYLGMQDGDVPITFADINDTKTALNWEPKTSIADGLKFFTDWFLQYNESV